MTKFHKDRTATSSPLEGALAYAQALSRGELSRVGIRPTSDRSRPGVWRLLSVEEIDYQHLVGKQPLEVSSVRIRPRAPLLDEVTRHRNTFQTFVPITGSFIAVACPSSEEDSSRPDPKAVEAIPVLLGEGIEIGEGTWHTLPFVFAGEVLGLSIMHREDLHSYHDVRDLVAEGWIGYIEWPDRPE